MTRDEAAGLALEACERAYVPYSHFPVGAALLLKNGEAITGCNIENASYGLCNCAERTALFAAYARGVRKEDIDCLIIATPASSLTPPCGACRQVMSELLEPCCPVVLTNGKQSQSFLVKELLPYAFTQDSLAAL